MGAFSLRQGDQAPMIDGVEVTSDAAELNKLDGAGAVVYSGPQAEAITDISVTGTYATDDDAIETAVNSILAALRAAGIVAES